MGLTDRMIRSNKEQERQKKKETQIQLDPEDGETGMIYMPRPAFKYLNEDKGVFDNTDETSINTAKSVFDKTAIFRTNRE